MPDDQNTVGRDTYNYHITAGPLHCEGKPNTCPPPHPGDYVTYSWPNLQIGTNYYARNSVLFDAKDQIFSLPFSDAAPDMGHNAWLYSPGSWHHAIDYYRNDTKTFKVDAAAPGKVIYIGWDTWSGNTMVISYDVGSKKDVYRTIYMHLQNDPAHDCDAAWTQTIPTLNATDQTAYKAYLNSTGCPLNKSQRHPDPAYWGKSSQKIDTTLLGKTVAAGKQVAWSGSTGPGGCGCMSGSHSGPNTHLHVFFAHRDPVDSHWYFFDPYGIYSYPSCYPTGVNEEIHTACARYPIAWKNGQPNYANGGKSFTEAGNKEISANEISDARTAIVISPNPSAGNITITYTSSKSGSINLAVYDKTGMAIFKKTDYAIVGNNTYHINLSAFISGVYYLELNSGGTKTGNKFIINK
jgi:murein DD-endopeptidase MepM/ murein hydrolase activator NlpD